MRVEDNADWVDRGSREKHKKRRTAAAAADGGGRPVGGRPRKSVDDIEQAQLCALKHCLRGYMNPANRQRMPQQRQLSRHLQGSGASRRIVEIMSRHCACLLATTAQDLLDRFMRTHPPGLGLFPTPETWEHVWIDNFNLGNFVKDAQPCIDAGLRGHATFAAQRPHDYHTTTGGVRPGQHGRATA